MGQVAASLKDATASTQKEVSFLLESASELNSLLSTLDLKLPTTLPSFSRSDDMLKQSFRFATSQVDRDLYPLFICNVQFRKQGVR